MFPRDALTTISQTQVRAVNSRQPSSRSRGHRREPGRCGIEERRAGSGERLQHDQFPDARGIREQQRRGRRLDGHASDVGGEHHAAPRQAVGEDAADEQENHERGRLRGNHEA
jgi:hypothetical protein